MTYFTQVDTRLKEPEVGSLQNSLLYLYSMRYEMNSGGLDHAAKLM